MKIVTLIAENIKRLVAVEIAPDGNMVVIAGKNGAGKTSVLDSLWWCLSGATHIQAVPIRNGADTARIRLDLGEIIVTRTFARSKDGDKVTTALTVENADGARFPSPQRMLDDLLGELSFDPLAFTRMAAKEQLVTLRRFVPDVDFDAIEAANRADYETRTNVNRQAKALRTQLTALKVPGDPRQERVDETELVQRLESAGEHNAEIERRKARREQVERDATDLEAVAVKHEQRAAELRRQAQIEEDGAKDATREAKVLREKLAAAGELPEPVETAAIKESIAKARETNRDIDERERVIEQRERLTAEAEAAEKKSAALTDAMQKRTAEVSDLIAKSALPVEGITLAEDHVLYNGLPLDQASDAEQLRISVAIAAAMNSKLKVIRVRDGSLLDDDGLKLLAELADKYECQIWLEKVDTSGKVGFVISDGSLAKAETEAA